MLNIKEVNKLYELSYGHVIAKAMHIAMELKLDEVILPNESYDLEALAHHFNFSVDGMRKLFNILDAYYIIQLGKNDQVSATQNTPLLRYLNSPHITLSYKAIDHLQKACQLNQEVFSKTYDNSFFGYLQNKNLLEQFGKWCTDSAKLWLPSILEIYDFSSYQSLVDIGGGEGYLLGMILQRHPHINASLFDQETIIKGAVKVLQEYGVKNRVSLVSGNFFDQTSIPKNQDGYIICRALLNWSNEDALKIINNCAAAMRPDSKLLIIDFYIPPKDHTHYQRALLSDAVLLSIMSSANRTLPEWLELVNRSSLKVGKVYMQDHSPTSEPIMPFCVIELTK